MGSSTLRLLRRRMRSKSSSERTNRILPRRSRAGWRCTATELRISTVSRTFLDHASGGNMDRSVRLVALFALVWLFWPTAANAQSAIAGVVKDTSGAVLPGVNVEASSPALIEKSRSVVTDTQGQYKIV